MLASSLGKLAHARGMTEIARSAGISRTPPLKSPQPRERPATRSLRAAFGPRLDGERRPSESRGGNFPRPPRPGPPANPAPWSQSDFPAFSLPDRSVAHPSGNSSAPGYTLLAQQRAASNASGPDTAQSLKISQLIQPSPAGRVFIVPYRFSISTPRTGTIQFPPGLQKSEASL